MRANPDILTLGRCFGRHGGIEVKHAITSRVRRHRVEVVFQEIETEREDLDEPPSQFETLLPVGDAAVLEPR
jgi:hypothetical protein